MAIKVRCQQCRKKISIDEAFAGGNCRCPYCKAITTVSVRSAVSRAARPDRPDTPTAVPDSQVLQIESAEAVPQAKPVRVQGIVTLVLSGFLALLLVAGVILIVKYVAMGESTTPKGPAGANGQVHKTNGNGAEIPTDDNGDGENLPPMPDPTNPFTVKGPNVAGMGITGPVVYVLDGSSGTRDLYDPIVAVVRYSILAMGLGEKFNVVVLNDEGFNPLGDRWITGGEAGDEKAKQFLADCQPEGETDLAGGIRRAMKANPKTIVVLTGKAVVGADELAKQAKQADVGIFTVMLDSPPDAVKVMEKLAADTSGQCRQFTSDDLVNLLSEASPLP